MASAIAQSPTSTRFGTARSLATVLPPRPRTTSEATSTNQSISGTDSLKGRAVTSIWETDSDPLSSTPTPFRSASLRSSTPIHVLRKPRASKDANGGSAPTSPPISTTGIAGGGSVPPVTKKQRMSLLFTASDSLFSFGARRNSVISRKPTPQTISELDQTPVLDIRAVPLEITDEEAEREALRNEAAKSVGLGSSFALQSERSRATLEEGDVDGQSLVIADPYEGSPLVRRPSVPVSGSLSPSIDHGPSFSSKLASLRSAESSVASFAPETPMQQSVPIPLPTPSGSIPPYPATLSSLLPFTQNASTLLKYHSGGSFFTSKSRQWKPRHLVLTSFKPTSGTSYPSDSDENLDTQAHLHLFKSSDGDEKELERMKIYDDSLVFVVDEGPEVAGRKFTIKIGGLYAGGTSFPRDSKRKMATPSMAAVSVMGHPAMAINLGPIQDVRVVWLLQCPDSLVMQQWINSAKAALLIQRAERAGLAMSLQTAPADIRLTGDIDVILSLRAQGLLSPVTPTSPITPATASSALASHVHSIPASGVGSTAIKSEEASKLPRSGRTRSSTTAGLPSSSSAVSALRGLFTSASAVPNGGVSAGTSGRPRSFSSSASSPASPLSTPALSMTTSLLPSAAEVPEEPQDGQSIAASSFGNRANALFNLNMMQRMHGGFAPSTSSLLINQSISSSIAPHEEVDEMSFDDASIRQSDRERLHVAYSSFERPASSGSLPPPPRSKRLGSISGCGSAPPRSPVLETSLQEELKKAMFTAVKEINPKRLSADTIPEEGVASFSPSRESTFRTSLDGRGRVSFESGEPPERLVPFPAPNGVNGSSHFGKSTASFGVDGMQPRPSSSLSNVSTASFHASSNGGATISERTQSQSGSSRHQASPKLSRKVPKMLAPPSGPIPAPPQPAAGPEEPSPTTSKERGSTGGTSFFSAKRISGGSTGLSIRSFTSGSSSSRSNNALRSNGVQPPRPPPAFAPPPIPSPTSSSDYGQALSPLESPKFHPYAAEGSYSPSLRSVHRNSMLSNSSASPARSEFNVRLHRLTPPAPPPSAALPPRPDSLDGAIATFRAANGHTRSSSLSSSPALSTIPASPTKEDDDLPATNGDASGSKRLNSLPAGLSPPSSVGRRSSLKARLRMLSSPSPRPPTDALPPIPATAPLPDQPQSSAMLKIVAPIDSSRGMAFELDVAAQDSPISPDRPIITPSEVEQATTTLKLPPIPPRSQSRPHSPRKGAASSSSPERLQRTLSPPPRRGSRQSRELLVTPIPLLPLDSSDDSAPRSPIRRNGDWDVARRDSGVLM